MFERIGDWNRGRLHPLLRFLLQARRSLDLERWTGDFDCDRPSSDTLASRLPRDRESRVAMGLAVLGKSILGSREFGIPGAVRSGAAGSVVGGASGEFGSNQHMDGSTFINHSGRPVVGIRAGVGARDKSVVPVGRVPESTENDSATE